MHSNKHTVPFHAIFIHAIVTYPSDWGKADQSMIKMLNPDYFQIVRILHLIIPLLHFSLQIEVQTWPF